MPWLRPMVSVYLCSNARALQRRQDGVEVLQQQIGGLGQLHRQAGVQHVGTGHAEMHEAAVRADRLGEPGQEGDDVVARLALDGVDPFDVGGSDGGELRAALLANGAGGGFRDGAGARHGLGGQGFDLEPDAIAVLRRTRLRPSPGGCSAEPCGPRSENRV